jgi:hypothetical protein
LRHALATFALVLAVAVGLAAPAAAPALAAGDPNGPKVVIVVGATHGVTETYRQRADQAYAEAIKHTANVVKVYSPNATWAKVKAAAVGANILIYFGHGNGWPSPYTYDPEYTTKDGFGLNATAGNGDHNNKYYGEPYVADLDLAPNALVMLHHLCYASGNSEPNHAAPSLSVAKQRVDNYGAGFLRSPARAVLADGHRGPVEYLRLLFTTNQTIEQLWKGASNANGNVISFASTRTPGKTALMDPETPTSGFYRSLVGDRSLTTKEITHGFAVPGNAAPKPAGAALFDAPPASAASATGASTLLPEGTRLRLLEIVSGSGDDAIFRVEGLDDDGISGYALARDLEPRDSVAPSLASLAGGGGKAYSTVASDGRHKVSGTFSETVAWTATILHGEDPIATKEGSGSSFSLTFDPAVDGVGDGTYGYRVTAVDSWRNGPTTSSGEFDIDTTGPVGTVAIDGGAATAMTAMVRVNLDATDARSSISQVRLSNKPEVDAAGLLVAGTTYDDAGTLVWQLLAGEGTKKVYAQWRDSAGNWSTPVSDAIVVEPPDATYHAATPVRLLDTRADLPSGAVKLSASKTYRFQVAGRGGVPADAIAVTGNLTVTGSTAGGYVTLGPIVSSNPSTSTINVPKGDTRANGVVVPLDRNGRLQTVFKGASGASTHLVLDVTGYFTADDSGARYHSTDPARFLDTRLDHDVTGGATLKPSVPVAVSLGGRSVGATSIPADAVAVTGNLTVTGQTAKGYLTLTPTPQPTPSVSTLNFPLGDTRANNVTVPLGDGGRTWLVYRGSGTAHAVLDVTGYYRPGSDGLRWVPLAPMRVLDSRIGLGRDGAFKAKVPGSVTVLGKGGVATDAVALTGNLTVTKQTRKGYGALTPVPVAAPTTSTINFPTGESRANGVVSKIDVATGKVSLTYRASDGATTHFIIDVTGYFH